MPRASEQDQYRDEVTSSDDEIPDPGHSGAEEDDSASAKVEGYHPEEQNDNASSDDKEQNEDPSNDDQLEKTLQLQLRALQERKEMARKQAAKDVERKTANRPSARRSETVPKVSNSAPVPKASKLQPVPKASKLPPVPKASKLPPVPKASKLPPVPKASKLPPVPKASKLPPVQDDQPLEMPPKRKLVMPQSSPAVSPSPPHKRHQQHFEITSRSAKPSPAPGGSIHRGSMPPPSAPNSAPTAFQGKRKDLSMPPAARAPAPSAPQSKRLGKVLSMPPAAPAPTASQSSAPAAPQSKSKGLSMPPSASPTPRSRSTTPTPQDKQEVRTYMISSEGEDDEREEADGEEADGEESHGEEADGEEADGEEAGVEKADSEEDNYPEWEEESELVQVPIRSSIVKKERRVETEHHTLSSAEWEELLRNNEARERYHRKALELCARDRILLGAPDGRGLRRNPVRVPEAELDVKPPPRATAAKKKRPTHAHSSSKVDERMADLAKHNGVPKSEVKQMYLLGETFLWPQDGYIAVQERQPPCHQCALQGKQCWNIDRNRERSIYSSLCTSCLAQRKTFTECHHG